MEGVEVVGVVGVVEEEVKVEEDKEIRVIKVKIRVKTQVRATPGTRPPGMRTCRRSRPACATGPMGSRHIFVLSQPPVPGKIILSLNLIIKPETLTSSAKKKIYKIYFIRLFRK